jgi:hypothetical protein
VKWTIYYMLTITTTSVTGTVGRDPRGRKRILALSRAESPPRGE